MSWPFPSPLSVYLIFPARIPLKSIPRTRYNAGEEWRRSFAGGEDRLWVPFITPSKPPCQASLLPPLLTPPPPGSLPALVEYPLLSRATTASLGLLSAPHPTHTPPTYACHLPFLPSTFFLSYFNFPVCEIREWVETESHVPPPRRVHGQDGGE